MSSPLSEASLLGYFKEAVSDKSVSELVEQGKAPDVMQGLGSDLLTTANLTLQTFLGLMHLALRAVGADPDTIRVDPGIAAYSESDAMFYVYAGERYVGSVCVTFSGTKDAGKHFAYSSMLYFPDDVVDAIERLTKLGKYAPIEVTEDKEPTLIDAISVN